MLHQVRTLKFALAKKLFCRATFDRAMLACPPPVGLGTACRGLAPFSAAHPHKANKMRSPTHTRVQLTLSYSTTDDGFPHQEELPYTR